MGHFGLTSLGACVLGVNTSLTPDHGVSEVRLAALASSLTHRLLALPKPCRLIHTVLSAAWGIF